MARYLARTCPRCGDYLGVVVPEPKEPVKETAVRAICLRCGYRLPLRILPGKRGRLASFGALLIFLLSLAAAHSHPGGLDSYGCHHDRKQGGYHCHQGMFAGQRFESKEEMLRRPQEGKPYGAAAGEKKAEFRVVRRVVDGDTVFLESGERVRLIGVDTPETKHPQKPVEYFGREATRFTRGMVQGKGVRLEFDQANAHIGHKERYGRLLAYVFLEGGTFLNAEIIKQGYGFAYTCFPFKYMEEFWRLEREACGQGRGLWGKST